MPRRIKEIPGLPGYFIGSDGTVWSAWKRRIKYWRKGCESYISDSLKEMKPFVGHHGYLFVVPRLNGKQVCRSVHHLVLLAFRGECPTGLERRHKNGNPADNRLRNLAYGTRKQNAKDRDDHGRTCIGEANGNSKLTLPEVREIRSRIASGESHSSIARSYGIWPGTVSAIRNRKLWRRLA